VAVRVVLLAAGEGRRMGGIPKALLRYEGSQSFLARLCATVREAGCEPLAVLGAEADRVRAAHPDLPSVVNPRWEDGQLSSVCTGLEAALDAGAELVLVHPVDMPEVRADTVRKVIAGVKGEGALPSYDGALGHPLALTAAGARLVLDSDAETLEDAIFRMHLQRVDVGDPGTAVNFNTPDVYERIFGRPPEAIDR
jgi:molybdenum cofactor cytidylyltransferase